MKLVELARAKLTRAPVNWFGRLTPKQKKDVIQAVEEISDGSATLLGLASVVRSEFKVSASVHTIRRTLAEIAENGKKTGQGGR